MTIVLALDISTHTGAAWDGPRGVPLLATWDAPQAFDPEDYGTRYAAFRQWLVPMVGMIKPEILAFEAPLPRQSNARVARLLLGLAAHAEEIGSAAEIEVIEKNVKTIKAFWTGHGSADKADMMFRCRQLGWQIKNDHEADAAGLWALVKSEVDQTFHYQESTVIGRRSA